MLQQWQQQAAGRTDIRVALDDRTAQALVFAPQSVHAQIQQQLVGRAAPVAAPAPVIAPATPAVVSGSTPVITPNVGLNLAGGAVLFQLRQLPAAEVHGKLEGLLSRQLPATVDASGEWQSFPVEASPGAAVTMSVNLRQNQLRLDGPPTQVAAWRSVIEALDSPPTSPDRVTKLVTTGPNSHDRVRKTLQVLQADGSTRTGTNGSLVATLFQPNANDSLAASIDRAAGCRCAGDRTRRAGRSR